MTYRSAGKKALLLSSLILLPSLTPAQSGNKCLEPPVFYEKNGYSVRDVRVVTPLDWLFGSVDRKLAQILADPSMPIKKGDPYRKANSDAGFIKLNENYPELTVSRSDRFAVRLAMPALENCNAQTRMLDVVYHVYTFSLSYYLSRAFETGRKEEIKRSVVDAPATQKLDHYFPQPFVAFNRSRGWFGGSKLSINQNGSRLNQIVLGASGSSSSAEAQAAARGSRDYDEGLIRHFEYQGEYVYSDIPADSIKLKESSALGQIFVATRAFGSWETIFRFGSLIEGGNKQTNLNAGSVTSANPASSGYGSVKTFVGATLRVGRHALKSSYGLQLGSTDPPNRLDYVKQVFDTAANLRFLVKDHKPITLDLQFTAGSINTRGQLPVAERFFGGNVETSFIAADTWTIRSNPFIRSFPQNTFNRTTAAGVPGGDSFLSANVTFAPTIWGKPLVPPEILMEPEFPGLIEFEFSAAESSLRNEYLSSTPEFREVAQMVKPLLSALDAVDQELGSIERQNPAQEVTEQITLCRTDLGIARQTAETINEDLTDGPPKTADIRKLVVGFPSKTPPIASYVSDLIDDLTTLRDTPSVPAPNNLSQRIADLESRRQMMANAFIALDQSALAKQQEQRAQREMKYPRRVFDQLTHEANLIAVSPVAIFDVARLSQRGVPTRAVRYAIGGGLRLSVVSLDVTAGYAWNPTRQPWERRGALIFSMEVSNLFR